jgi:DNA-binding transcriptional MocR family regulator
VAEEVRTAIRAEARARQRLVTDILPAELVQSDPNGYHAWLSLPSVWNRSEFLSRLRAEGVGVVSSDAFALGTPPEAVRLGLGAATTRPELETSLKTIADLLWGTPELSSMVV